MTSRILDETRNGSIVLAHDLHKSTVDAMPDTLDGLLKRDFQFVTVSQLLTLNSSSSDVSTKKPAQSKAIAGGAEQDRPESLTFVRAPAIKK